jgi:hypothetical protein
MHRRAVVWGLVVVLATAGGARAAQEQPERADELIDALNRAVKFPGIEDPKATLIEALDQLARMYDLSFEVNERAFKFEMVPDVLKTEVELPNPIPPMNATPAHVLRKVLARVPVPSDATFLVRKDTIEITTGLALRDEVWGANYRGPWLPLVYVRFERVPLQEALRELARQTDTNIVLDVDVGRRARVPVTARLRNAPLGVAVRLLADMADLRAVQVANVVYVTTPRKADRLQARVNAESALYARLYAQAEGPEAPTFTVPVRVPVAPRAPARRRPSSGTEVPVFQPAEKP